MLLELRWRENRMWCKTRLVRATGPDQQRLPSRAKSKLRILGTVWAPIPKLSPARRGKPPRVTPTRDFPSSPEFSQLLHESLVIASPEPCLLGPHAGSPGKCGQGFRSHWVVLGPAAIFTKWISGCDLHFTGKETEAGREKYTQLFSLFLIPHFPPSRWHWELQGSGS